MTFEFRYKTQIRPRKRKSGEMAFALGEKYLRERHELALTLAFITHRRLFGLAYCGIQPDYFHRMPQESGVYICIETPTALLTKKASYPGDIDLLIIPYEGDELLLHRVVAIEIKAVRPTFLNQGKSPNQMGFSQADGLLQMGFPYAGVAHLIVSDRSPTDTWRELLVFEVVRSDGLVEPRGRQKVDCLPDDLVDRSSGRLIRAGAQAPSIGLIVAYLGATEEDLCGNTRRLNMWHPFCRAAMLNTQPDHDLLLNTAHFFEKNVRCFLDNPRFDPIS